MRIGTSIAFGALLLLGCRRNKIPVASYVWLGPSAGCALLKEHPSIGPVACWGVNDASQLGDGTTEARPFATTLALGGKKLTSVALGARHACGILDGRAHCWGDGSDGQLGPGLPRSPVPVLVGDRQSPKDEAVAVGGAHTCVRTGLDDHLVCFGKNDEGQLGGKDAAGKTEWDQGPELRAVALGEAHTCAAYAKTKDSVESVVCRGRKGTSPAAPFLVGVPVRTLVAGKEHTCALLENRTVRCWGSGTFGQLGDGTGTSSLEPVSVLDLRGVEAIAAGANHTCALLGNRTVACWGKNDHHQIANGTTANVNRPSVVVGLVQIRQLAAAGDGACAIVDDGLIRCWGDNDRHQLGDGSVTEHTVPMPVKYR